MSEPNFTAGSVKARVLETVHKLGRSAYRSMIFAARISTDETVATALEALVRDRYLIVGSLDLHELTDAGRSAIDAQPISETARAAAVASTVRTRKQCRKCREFKDPLADFGRAPRAPDGRTFDCNHCRGVATAVQVPVPMPVAAPVIQADASDQVAETLPPTAAPLVLTVPTIMGFYVKIEADRVYISQPGQECESLKLNRERGLALGKFLCANLGEAT